LQKRHWFVKTLLVPLKGSRRAQRGVIPLLMNRPLPLSIGEANVPEHYPPE
jgi:hypothetical protein